MQPHFERELLDLAGLGGSIASLSRRVIIPAYRILEFPVCAAKSALHERRGQVGLYSRVGAALCDHGLTHVGYRVDIEMRRGPHEPVRPVAAAQGDLLGRSELQASVSAEVYHDIRAEAHARPEVFGDIGIRRGVVGAVDYLEFVIAHARRKLGKQHDVAELHPRNRKPSVFGRKVASREFSVHLGSLRGHLRTERLGTPFLIIGCRNQPGIPVFDEIGYRPFGVGAEHGALALDEFSEFSLAGRKPFNPVAGRTELLQEIVERRQHFHACGRQAVLSGSLVVEYRDLLLAVRKLLQRDVPVHGLNELLQPAGNRLEVLEAVLALIVAEKGERTYRPVYLRSHDALRHESSAHAHPVLLPLADQGVDVQRSEQRRVPLLKEVGYIVPHPSVRHVDERGDIHGIGMVLQDEKAHVVHRIDILAALLQRGYELGGVAHGAGDHDARRPRLEKAFGAQPALIFPDRGEGDVPAVGVVRIGMVQQTVFRHGRRSRLVGPQQPAADFPAHIFEHVVIIGAVTAGKICRQGLPLEGVHRSDVVGRIRRHGGDHGHSPFGRLADEGALVFGDAHAHSVDEHEVAARNLPEVLAVKLPYPDESVRIGFGNLPESHRLVVDEPYPHR